MSTPVVTDKWAGNFDCAVCRRKRLTAEEFSKKALDKHRATGGPLKCGSCVAHAAADEQRVAEERRRSGGNVAAAINAATQDGASEHSSETRECASCHATLGSAAYSRSQWSRGEGVSRCRSCVDAAEDAAAVTGPSMRRHEATEEARQALDVAQSSGDARAILAAESAMAALEAERVTGLKPVRLSGGRRGGGGRGSRGGHGSRAAGARGRGSGRAASRR